MNHAVMRKAEARSSNTRLRGIQRMNRVRISPAITVRPSDVKAA